jgi:hypothetical protein
MTIEERIRQQLLNLIEDGRKLTEGDPKQLTIGNACAGWLAAADHIVSMVCRQPTDPYRRSTSAIITSGTGSNYVAHRAVGKMTALLNRLANDVENGLIASVVSIAQAEALDDLLDQAEDYHRKQHKVGAGILATAVFEDTVRRVARANEVADSGTKLDTLITELDQRDVITSIVAKRCRAAAGVRNGALHAQWDTVTLEDVESVLRLTRELLSDRLAK